MNNLPRTNTDRNLLFGILALQVDLIDRDQLVAAMNRWALEKDKPLGQILLEDGALKADTHKLLDALAEKHLQVHGGDAEQSLQHISSIHLDNGSLETLTFAVGESTSEGQRFRVLRPHAEGGLGEIFVARDEELNREVALKQIREKYAEDPDSRSRFTVEAEITGRLEHPNIVPVYGLGCHQNGHPFYAMRLIHGDSLKEAAGRLQESVRAHGRGLTVGSAAVEFRKLLGCFISVCNAIEYAHSRGIVHRDIKPSNIMLGRYGETLVVDWGLAKPIDEPESPSVHAEAKLRPSSGSYSTPTQMGSAIGTPAYMSPEQAFGHVDQVGPASDVYCLGSTLYSLLTGEPPFVDKDIGSTLRRVQSSSFTRPREVRRDIPAPLEAICLKAMAHRGEDRYSAAGELAEDIEKWLADEPVNAFKEPLSARTRRWIRRHQSAFTGAAATVLVSVASLAVGILALSSKNRELLDSNRRENQANVQLSRAKEVAEQRFELALDSIDDYYTGVSEDLLLEQPGLQELRHSLLARPLEFYQQLQNELDGDLDPKAQAALARAYSKVAEITADVGSKKEALHAHQRAVEILEKLSATEPAHLPQLARSYNLLGVLQRVTGEFDRAMESYQKAIEIRERLVGADPESDYIQDEVAESYNNLGSLQRDIGDESEAAASFRHAIDIREQLAAKRPNAASLQNGLARCYNNLGVVLRKLGKSADAVAAYQQAVDRRTQLVNQQPDNRSYKDDLAGTYNNLSVVQRSIGERGHALESSQKSIEIRERLVSDFPNVNEYHQGLAASYNNIGNLYRGAGDTAAALEAYQKVMAICERLEADNPNLAEVQDNLARTYHNIGILQNRLDQDDAAIASFKKAIELREVISEKNPKDHEIKNDIAQSCLNLGVMFRATGANDEALAQYQRAIAIRSKLVEEAPSVAEFQEDLASCYNNLGNLHSSMEQMEEAMSCFHQALEIQERLANADSDNRDSQNDLARSHHNLGVLQRNAEQSADALISWARAISIRERLATENSTVKSYTANLLKSHRLRAALLHDLGRLDESIADWDRAIELSATSKTTSLRLRRASTVASTKDYEDAVQEANELSSETNRGETLYEAASVLSAASATAASDSRLDTETRKTRAKHHATRAIELLSAAAKLDYFNDQDAAESLLQDMRLDPLRSLDAFKSLVDSLPAPEDVGVQSR
jgi:serine/threonine-protein kinase